MAKFDTSLFGRYDLTDKRKEAEKKRVEAGGKKNETFEAQLKREKVITKRKKKKKGLYQRIKDATIRKNELIGDLPK